MNKNMKFVSKNPNLRIVLRPGLEANRLAGKLAEPGIYTKFQDGFVDVKIEEHSKMMLEHPGFNVDYILADNIESDPYEDFRQSTEPEHQISEVKHGSIVKSTMPKKKVKLPKELQAIINQKVEDGIKVGLKAVLEEMSGAAQTDVGTTSESEEVNELISPEETEEVTEEEPVEVIEPKKKTGKSKKKK